MIEGSLPKTPPSQRAYLARFFAEKFANKPKVVPLLGFSNRRDDGAGDKNQEFPTQNSYKIEVWENECNVSVKVPGVSKVYLKPKFVSEHKMIGYQL